MKDGNFMLHICFKCRTSFKMALTIYQKWIKYWFVKKIQILLSSDHQILFKLFQLVVKIAHEELQIVFLTYTVSNSNRNKKNLNAKIRVKMYVPIGYLLPLQINANIGSLNFICSSIISV